MSSNVEHVKEVYDERETTSAKTGIALRTEIAKALFEELPEDEQADWKQRGDADWESLCKKVEAAQKGEPSVEPTEQEK